MGAFAPNGAFMRRAHARTGRVAAALWVALASTLPFVQHCHVGGDELHSYYDDADPAGAGALHWHAHLLLGSLELQVPAEPQDCGKRSTIAAFETKAPDAPLSVESGVPLDSLAAPQLVALPAAASDSVALPADHSLPRARATRPLILRL
jgi:hypothetical protein